VRLIPRPRRDPPDGPARCILPIPGGKTESQRSTGDESDGSGATALNNVADDIDAGDDAELVVLVERLQGYYVPETDEFVPTAVAVEIIEGFEGDDAKELVRRLGDAATPSEGRAAVRARLTRRRDQVGAYVGAGARGRSSERPPAH
jgi:hypothetical protein